jgi:hypothetical protein
MLAGARGGSIASPRLLDSAHLAHRFALAYAHGAYWHRSPRLPGATAAVSRKVALAAKRVPPDRRRLRPRLLTLVLQPEGATALSANARIGDRRSPPFSVGFTVERVGRRWQVVAISLPG